MGVAFIGYSWDYVGPDATVGVYLHGFPTNAVAAIDVQATTGNRPGFQPRVEVTATEVGEHVDGTLFHTIWVHNTSISNGGPPTPWVGIGVNLEYM